MVSSTVINGRRGGSVRELLMVLIFVRLRCFPVGASPPDPETDVKHDQEEEGKDEEKADASLRKR